MIVSKKIVLHFPVRLVDRSIVYHLIKDYDLELNIMKASIIPDAEGLMVIEVRGEQTDYDKGVKYLTETGVCDAKRGQMHALRCVCNSMPYQSFQTRF